MSAAHHNRICLFTIAIFFIAGHRGLGQKGDYFIRNFLPKDYAGSANNFGITQNNDGLVFIANNEGVLIFDGINWSQCHRSDYVSVVSVGKAANGEIVAGTADGDIALISKTNRGSYKFTSLSHQLPEKDRPTDYVRQIFAVGETTYFLSADKLIEYSGSKLRAYHPESSFHSRALVMGKNIFVTETGKSISLLQDGKLVPLKGTSELAAEKYFFCYPISKTRYAIGFRNIGIYIADYDSLHPWRTTFTKRSSNCDELVIASEINNGCMLTNGNFVVTSNKKGAFTLDTSLAVVSRLDSRNGINEDNIKAAFQDQNGNLWLALYYGVAFVEINSVVTRYNRSNGINGVVQSCTYFENKLFIATDKGVQYYDSLEHKFVSLLGFDKQSWYLLAAHNRLFVGTLNGLYLFEGGQIRLLSEDETFSLHLDPFRRGLLYAGTATGVNVFRLGQRDINLIKQIPLSGPTKNIATDSRGNTYFNTIDRHIYYLDKKREFQLDTLDGMSRLPADYFENFVFSFDGDLMIGTFKGLYSVRQNKNGRLFCQKDKRFWQSTQTSEIFRATQFGSSIVCSQRYFDTLTNKTAYPLTILKTVKKSDVESMAINHLKDVLPNDITYDSTRRLVLISTNEGLFLLGENLQYANKSYNFFLNKFISGRDTLVENLCAGEDAASISIVIPFDANDLQVILGLNSTELSDPEFSYQLEGSDPDFNKWSNDNKITLSNMAEGKYVLKLRARTQPGAAVYEINLPFRIMPPWYRTWQMYVVYLLAFAAFVSVLIRLNSKRLTRLNKKLEQIIDERTSTISIQKQELEHKQKEILDSINYAQRIQHSLLASEKFLRMHLPSHFILFKPKDVVSGDFYWAAQLQNGRFILVTADSTGHGVPGAIMSMLNISCLKEAVESEKLSSPSEILNHTRKKVIETLANDGSAEGGKDGMDCSLVSFDFNSRILSYAAANNPVWIIRKNATNSDTLGHELIELLPDKMPVGKHDKDTMPFSENSIQLQKNDMVFTLTDGLPDQFGGPKGKKFMYKQLKELLLSIAHLPSNQQRDELEKTLFRWQGNLEQVDDITLIGIRIG